MFILPELLAFLLFILLCIRNFFEMTNWRIFYVLTWWLQSRICATSRPRHVSKDSNCCSFYYPLRLRLHLLHSNHVGSVPLPSAFISHVSLGSMSLCSRSSPARVLHSSNPYHSARPRQAPASATLLSAFNLPLQALAPCPLLSFERLEGQAAPLRLRLGPVSALAPWPAPGLRSIIATPPRTTSSLGSCSATDNFSQRHALDSTSFSPGRLQDLRPRRPRASAFASASGVCVRVGLGHPLPRRPRLCPLPPRPPSWPLTSALFPRFGLPVGLPCRPRLCLWPRLRSYQPRSPASASAPARRPQPHASASASRSREGGDTEDSRQPRLNSSNSLSFFLSLPVFAFLAEAVRFMENMLRPLLRSTAAHEHLRTPCVGLPLPASASVTSVGLGLPPRPRPSRICLGLPLLRGGSDEPPAPDSEELVSFPSMLLVPPPTPFGQSHLPAGGHVFLFLSSGPPSEQARLPLFPLPDSLGLPASALDSSGLLASATTPCLPASALNLGRLAPF